MTSTLETRQAWLRICAYAQLVPERGVAALLPDGTQVALFRLADGSVHAIGQRDPFSGANVMSRGIVGSRGDRDTVTSPMLKQEFDLSTGAALDVEGVCLPRFAATVKDGGVYVQVSEVAP